MALTKNTYNRKSLLFLNQNLNMNHLKLNTKNAKNMQATKCRSVAVMLACLYINMSCFGIFSALGVVYVGLISAFQCQRSEAALVQSLYLGLSLGGGLLFTKIVTRYDTGICVIIASLVTGIAVACASLARNIGTVIALVGVIAGLFVSVNIISSSIVINWMFDKNRKFALSILTFGASIGQTVLPYIADAVMEEYSWSGAFLILSAFAFLNCIPCGLIIYYSKQFFKKDGDYTSSHNNPSTAARYFTDGVFITYITTVFSLTTLGPVEMWFIVDVAVLKGFGIQSGTILLSLNGIFGFLGRLVCSLVLKFNSRIRPELHMCYGYLFFAVAHISAIVSPVYWGMFLGMVLRGLSSSLIVAFLPSLQLELRGPENFPQTVAISNLVMGIGDIIGGYIGGLTTDVTGSYNLIFYISTIGSLYCSACMLCIYVILKRRKRRPDQYEPLK